jgi:tRNA uridine 5-carbamoylmethylation protein Kti12
MLVIYRGLPGSGKTVRAKAEVVQHPRGAVARVNRDDIRQRVFATEYLPGTGAFEGLVTVAQHAQITALLHEGVTVICDDTNLYPEHIAALMRVAVAAGCGWEIRDFTHVPVSTCIARDRTRLLSPHGGYVGEEIIRRMYDKHSVDGWAPMPVPDLTLGVTE